MKTQYLLKNTLAAFIMIGLLSCEAEYEQPVQVGNSTVQFERAELEITENGSEKVITILLDKPASKAGLLVLEFDSVSSRLKTDRTIVGRKMEIDIPLGKQELSFTLLPSDNQISDGNLNILLTIASISSGFSIGDGNAIEITILDNEEPMPIETSISFVATSSTIREDGGDHELVFQLSNALVGAGTFEIEINSEKALYDVNYRTEPSAMDGKISISPAVGAQHVTLRVIPINNSIISGGLMLNLSITKTTGAITKGQQLSHETLITDDELAGLPKGYSVGGALGQRKTFTYDAIGRIASVVIERNNQIIQETYAYDDAGKITSIKTHPEMGTYFTWNGNQIIKSERVEFGVLKEYIEYDYDAQGNVAGTANYFRQPNGEFKLSFIVLYLYYTDNNLYKAMHYLPGNTEEEYTLLSTRTYENYLDDTNPFPMVNILPTVKTQTKLAGSFRLEENGQNLLYNLDYEFGQDGRVNRRYARNANTVETTDYFYY